MQAKLPFLTLLTCLFAITACQNQPREQTRSSPAEDSRVARSAAGPVRNNDDSQKFDYYLLVLSWAPEFCATHANNASSSECDPNRQFGFVVHGLWPQNEDGSYPQNCGAASPVAQSTVRRLLAIMPSRGLIQHEWKTHGTCSGLAANDYFSQIEKAYTSLQTPSEFKSVTQPQQVRPAALETEFARANRAPDTALRISCAGNELNEVEICLTKDLQFRGCPANLRDCRASQVQVRPIP